MAQVTPASEKESRRLCNKLMRSAAKMEKGCTLEIAEDDLAQLLPVDKNRLLCFIHHEMHQLAHHDGPKRVPRPGPGHYEDGLRQSSAARRTREGHWVTRFIADVNVHTDDLKPGFNRGASTSPTRSNGGQATPTRTSPGDGKDSPTSVPKLPPVSPRHKLPGPSLSGRTYGMDHEERLRRDRAGLGPGMYKPDKPARDATQPVSMKFRGEAAIAAKDPTMKPGPGAYADKQSAFPYQRPSNRMHPT
eukprot:CAMPEP_0174839198 /NCGR_PEP_ID=MMETSP1114-20130205/7886_1 /TAXON_ID=312471 /ORGANISM="Neobodo designis, Strain CCAP 1951/1" /LENGTH=246 /DNA_ID=CAMNT_0016073319 /DNA_START=37 /DNA_END=773 /DNA_ORIENTATION=+